MIYCVSYDDVRSYLRDLGWLEADSTGETVLFEKNGEDLTFHAPNVDGHIPEIIINDALNNSHIPLPSWDVFWCD